MAFLLGSITSVLPIHGQSKYYSYKHLEFGKLQV